MPKIGTLSPRKPPGKEKKVSDLYRYRPESVSEMNKLYRAIPSELGSPLDILPSPASHNTGRDYFRLDKHGTRIYVDSRSLRWKRAFQDFTLFREKRNL